MSYVATLSELQKKNADAVLKEMQRRGITNLYAQSAILSIISKETEFKWKAESGYSTTSNARIREVFPTKTKSLSEAQLTAFKKDDVKFFNLVYGGQYGNAANEGWKYRGRGPNQLTFLDNYRSIGGRLGIDLVNNPDLVITNPEVAAKVVVDFYIREFATGAKLGKLKQYNTDSINGFKTSKDSLNAVFQATRGWNKTGADKTGGYAKAEGRIDELYKFISENKGAVAGTGLFFFGVTIAIIILAGKNKKKKEAVKNGKQIES